MKRVDEKILPFLFAAAAAIGMGAFALLGVASDRDGSGHFTEYVYDEAGRIIGVTTVVDESPPEIASISPAIVRRGPGVAMTILGSGLRQAQIATSHPGLTVSAVTSSASRVTFELMADESVPLGTQPLALTTTLGSDSIDIEIFPRLPVIQIRPDPIALQPGQQVELNFTIDSADVIGHVFQLYSSDLNVASVTPAAAVIAAGELEPANAITVSAQALGTAALAIDTDEIVDLQVPLYVTEPWQIPPGGASFYSTPVGVRLGAPIPPPRLIEFGPFASRVGVMLAETPPPPTLVRGPVTAPLLGLTLGATLDSLSPASLVRGAGPVAVTVTGRGLDQVTSVSVIPPDDLSALISTAASDGSTLTVELDADPQAVQGLRQIRLLTASGQAVVPVTPGADRLRVTDPIPVIDSVDPIYLVRGESNETLTVRGRLLGEVSRLRIEPGDGLIIGAVHSISPDGRSLTVDVAVVAQAALGPRTVVLSSPAGDSDGAASAGNTVSVVEGIAGRVAPLAGPLLGIELGDGPPTPARDLMLASRPLGLATGGFIEGISPSAASVGTQITLTVTGQALQSVSNVSFEPEMGLTITDWTSAPDGNSMAIDVTVAADAPRLLRRLVVETASTALLPARPGADRVLVTEQLPEVRSVDPILLSLGSGPNRVRIRGVNLNDALAVRLSPADGAKVGTPVSDEDGRFVEVDMTVFPDALTGPRAIIVETPGGQSSSTPTPANTIRFVSGIDASVAPLSGPLLGVQVGTPPQPPPLDVELTAAPLGVVVDRIVSPPLQSRSLRSALLGVTTGRVVEAVNPTFLPVGTEHDLWIDGVDLAGVDEVQFDPADGISLISGPTFEAASEQIQLRIAVDPTAAQTVRRVRILENGELLTVASASADRVQLVGTEPVITSIAPINAIPGDTFALIIRGFNLFGVTAVTATPATGMSIDANPQGSADGREVIVNVTIAPDAAPGLRVIRVQTAGGLTSGDATSANTLRILGN